MSEQRPESTREQQVHAVIAAYLDAEASGSAPSPQELIKQHPELAAELESFLADHLKMREMASPNDAETVAPAEETPNADTATIPPANDTNDDAATSTIPDNIQVPGYEILGELGRGGMGVVYKARHLGLSRVVALKMILAGGHAGKQDVQRFLSEAEAVAAFSHPHIVQVYDFGRCGNLPYMALEYIEGGSLADRMKKGPLPAKQAAKLLEQIAHGMNAAHQAGIVHRDLKPDNVLLSEDGAPKVTDFGLAKKVEGGSGLTQTGAIMGTPSYMAPEQASGEGKRVGPAADVYALGAILYECLTGRPPFKAATPLDTVLQVVSSEPKLLRQINSKVPKDLETICLKCLEKGPLKRYVSAADLANDLCSWQQGEPIRACPVGRVERAIKWANRHKGLTAGLAAAVLALLLGTGVAVWYGIAASISADQAVQQAKAEAKAKGEAVAARKKAQQLAEDRKNALALAQKLAQSESKLKSEALKSAEREKKLAKDEKKARTEAEKARESEKKRADAEREAKVELQKALAEIKLQKQRADHQALIAELRLYANQLAQAQQAWKAGNNAEALELLNGCQWNLRDVEFRLLWNLWHTNSKQVTLTGHKDRVNDVAFGRHGKRLVSGAGSGDPTVRLWDVGTGKELFAFTGHKSQVVCVAISPDGKRVASGSGHLTGNTASGEIINIWGDARIWDVESRKELRILKGHSRGVYCVAFSPDGKRVVSVGGDSIVRVWDAETGQKKMSLSGHRSGGVYCAKFSPNGKRLVTGGIDQTVKVWDATTGNELQTLKGHVGGVVTVTFSSDGDRIVSGNGRSEAPGEIIVWDAKTGRKQLRLHLHGRFRTVRDVVFSPDGKRLVSLAKNSDPTKLAEIKVWDAQTGSELLTFSGISDIVHSLDFSTDGKHIVTGHGKQILLWNVGKSEHEFTISKTTERVSATAYDPDGKRIVIGDFNGVIRVWDVVKGKELHLVKAHRGYVTCVAFSPDGKRIVSALGIGNLDGRKRGEVKVWNAETGEELLDLKGLANEPVYSVAFSPNGKRLVTGSKGFNKPGELKMWDADTGKELRSLTGHSDDVNSVAFSPDGKQIVAGNDDDTVRIWNAETGQPQTVFKGHRNDVNSVAFSPDGKHIASGDDHGNVIVWEAETGRKLQIIETDKRCYCVAFSPDGKRIAAGSSAFDRKKGKVKWVDVRVWNADSGKELFALKGHTDDVRSVAFSPDGQRLISGSYDTTVKVWNVSK